jgi:hypothetical protein
MLRNSTQKAVSRAVVESRQNGRLLREYSETIEQSRRLIDKSQKVMARMNEAAPAHAKAAHDSRRS